MREKILVMSSMMILAILPIGCITDHSSSVRRSYPQTNKSHEATISGTCYTPPIRSDGEIITTVYKYEVRKRSNKISFVANGYRFIEENYPLRQNSILCVVLPYENSEMEAFFAPYQSYKDYRAGRISESQFMIRRSVFNLRDLK